jgi:hypothetical protein
MGFDPAKVVLQVYGDGDSAERLAEVQLGVAFGDGVTARVPDRETIFLIDAALVDAIPVDLEDFRARFVAQPVSATDVEKAVVAKPESVTDESETIVEVGDDEG